MSSSDSERSEHELSFYSKDKVKLMKETLKIIKPKKIKAMAPDCIKHLDIAEINSMLLEELLGISNKRLSYIFNGEDVDRETSSSESEEDNIDIISLDDISDDDNDFELGNNSSKQSISELPKTAKASRRKSELQGIIKTEKDKSKKSGTKQESDNEAERSRLMSVLELLELQARARAIRSQLAIETENTKNKTILQDIKQEDSDSDAVIIDSPRHNEIVITSESDFESEPKSLKEGLKKKPCSGKSEDLELDKIKIKTDLEAEIKQRKEKLLSKLQKIKLVRHKNIVKDISSKDNSTIHSKDKPFATSKFNENKAESNVSVHIPDDKTVINKSGYAKRTNAETFSENINCCDNDEIVINLDEDELDSVENA